MLAVAFMSDSDASRILAARQQAGLGQRRFARLLGVGIGTVQHWERERRQPQGLYQEKLESILREIEDDQARSDSRS